MIWFKRWLCRRSNSQLEDMASSIESLHEIILMNESGLQKGFRRLSMAQKQQSDTLELLVKESSTLKFTLARHHGLSISYEQALQVLDNLTKIELTANNSSSPQDVLAPLITRAINDLLSLCEIEEIAKVGKPYPTQACDVVGAIEQTQYPPGTVTEILQQGYQTIHGDVVRDAKVIVANEPSSTTNVTQLI